MSKKLMISTVFVSLFAQNAFGLFGRRYRDDYYQDDRSLTERAANTVAEKADEVAGAAQEARLRAQDRAARRASDAERQRKKGKKERKKYNRNDYYR